MGRQKVDLSKMFSTATQMSGAEAEVARLQAEVEQLRLTQAPELEVQIAALCQQLQSQSNEREISLVAIRPNPGQPRKTFSRQSIDSLAQTLAQDGQLQPIIVMPSLEDGQFDLFDGERRWRAAQQLGWQTLKAVTMPQPQDLHRKALLTTLHREDLNSLDKAEALLKEISEQTGIGTSEAPRILSTVVRRLDYQKRMRQVGELVTADQFEQEQGLDALGLSDSERSILKVLLDLGLNPASVSANDFRTLSLFPDLQTAIREANLKAAHAMVLQRLSAKKLGIDERKAAKFRAEATQAVVDKELTLAETQQWVSKIIEKHAPRQATGRNLNQAISIMRGLQKLSFTGIERSKLEDFRQSLQKKLQEVETALQTDE